MSPLRPVVVLWGLAGLVGAAGVTGAAPVVIHDSGRTRSLAPYYAAITPEKRSAHADSTDQARPGLHRYLPVRTPEMSPGRVHRRSLDHPPFTPLFVIGSDSTSRRWLAAYHDQLVQLGATGLLVQAETIDDLRTIARIGRGLTITPVAGSDLARNLGLRHYPALISREGIEQ